MAENTEKAGLPVLMTPQLMQLKITTELATQKLTISDVLQAERKLVFNEDHLQEMKDVLKNCDLIDKTAEETHKRIKAPFWDAGKACDNGKNLVLGETALIRNRVKPQYDKLLKAINDRKVLADQKKAADDLIKNGIEANLMEFSNKLVAANTMKELLEVERRINLEKSPSMAKKYGEFHQFAIERYDAVLLPVLKHQKELRRGVDGLNAELQAAEDNNDPDKMEEIDAKINDLSNEMLQNHAVVGEAVLAPTFFPTVHAQEVLPATKVKRTSFRIELDDVEVALKKARSLLEISINKEAAKVELEHFKKAGIFDGTEDIVHVSNGIRYIATREREAL